MDHDYLKSIMYKIRNYEIRIRKAVNSQLKGNFTSLFKGCGLEFDDVRAYQYGDDVRRIDWHVSAKGEDTYVKVFKEEKEQTIFFLVDVSHSQSIGKEKYTKIELSREICSVLSLSAAKEESEVGLICFSDRKEKYIEPDKGMKKAYEIMLNLYRLVPESLKTDLDALIHFALNLIKRRSIVVLISDFIDQGYEESLKALARKHDLIVIHVTDDTEKELPRLGIIPLIDKESGEVHWVNTSSVAFQKRLLQDFVNTQKNLENLCLKYRANYLSVNTREDFVPKLVKLFKIRNRSARGV
ncbi:MAG: DUF58 domain-containing protein [Microscillaceae bacterium]|nr:DUF58 domain-containing protein [Microscillaceae bacterium]